MPIVGLPPLFKFDNISRISWVQHGVSTSEFGNIGLRPDIDKNETLTNREKFFNSLGTTEENVVEMNQIHGNHVKVVGEKERGHKILATDAIISNSPGVALLVKSGDCVPVVLVDPVKRVVGVVHAGWRGTAQEVIRITVDHMEDHFGTKAQDLIVGIGPSIGPCCYEVDRPVIEAFSRFPYADRIFSRKRGNHANLDLWEANRFQLIERGVLEKNIEIAKFCTYDNPDLFFSDRKLGRQGGRFGALIYIKS